MSEKTVREMSEPERRRHSLKRKTFRAVIMGSVLLGIAAFLLGIGLYTHALAHQFIEEANNLSRSAESILRHAVDIRPFTQEVMRIYHGLDEEQRAEDESYYERFRSIEQSEDYSKTIGILQIFRKNNGVTDIYIAMYDPETSALVYVADADDTEETGCRPGAWESASEREIERFSGWDGKKELYYFSKSEEYGWICTCGVPVYSDSGEICSYILADMTLHDLITGVLRFSLNYIVLLILMTILLGIMMTRHMDRMLVEPINSIAGAARQYVRDKRENNHAGNHFGELNIRTGDEVENLCLVMSDIESELNAYENNLTKITAERERISTELDLATRIQAGMLPSTYPAFPDRKDFDIYAVMTPAKEVGGDFYDYFLIDDDHLCLVMADVSGKGIPAALFMMASKISLKDSCTPGVRPSEALAAVNSKICANNKQEMFVTVWLGILELSTGKLIASNAGHEYPVILQGGSGKFEVLKDRHGFVVGGLPDMEYQDYEIQLEKGSKIFLYTDGIVEAEDCDQKFFGMDRMMECLNENPSGSPYELVDRVHQGVDAFVGDAPRFDDLTMLCVHFIGSEAPEKGVRSTIMMKEMTIEATIENIPVVTDFVNEALETFDCPMKIVTQIDIAIDELFGNIAHYAYDPETGPATVQVEVEEDPMAVIITFIDDGKPYDPLSSEEPDITLSAEQRKVGGLGVFLVKKTMDDVSYEYKNGHNILRIRKNVN